jgi:hypothetical protein
LPRLDALRSRANGGDMPFLVMTRSRARTRSLQLPSGLGDDSSRGGPTSRRQILSMIDRCQSVLPHGNRVPTQTALHRTKIVLYSNPGRDTWWPHRQDACATIRASGAANAFTPLSPRFCVARPPPPQADGAR